MKKKKKEKKKMNTARFFFWFEAASTREWVWGPNIVPKRKSISFLIK